MKVIISLGSNINQAENIRRAQDFLRRVIPDVEFSKPVWTKPVAVEGRPLSTSKYLNCLADGSTELPEEEFVAQLKQIETSMGDSHSSHLLGNVIIDLDLIEYDGRQLREIIWK